MEIKTTYLSHPRKKEIRPFVIYYNWNLGNPLESLKTLVTPTHCPLNNVTFLTKIIMKNLLFSK